MQNLSDLPLMIKAVELAFVFEAEIVHPLGLSTVKAGNLRGILIVVRVKLEKKNDKNPTVSISLTRLRRKLADNFP